MKRGRFFIAVLAGLIFLIACWLLRERLQDMMVDDSDFAAEIEEAAKRYDLPPELVRAVVFQESRFDPQARGTVGEVGLMQILPGGAAAEWARLNKCPQPTIRELADPKTNLDIGCWYLAMGMRRYADHSDKVELALARYNAGQSRADKWKNVKPGQSAVELISISSTKEYVTKIMWRYRMYLKEAEEDRIQGESKVPKGAI